MAKQKDTKKSKAELIEQIKEISIFEDLNDPNVIKKISKLKLEIDKMETKKDDDIQKFEPYYETMSVTYIDDNGAISEVYRINDEIVTKEAFDEWSYDYFNVIRKQKEKAESEKIQNEITDLEQKLIEKKDLLSKKLQTNSKFIPDIRDSQSSKYGFYNNKSLNGNNQLGADISNSKFLTKYSFRK